MYIHLKPESALEVIYLSAKKTESGSRCVPRCQNTLRTKYYRIGLSPGVWHTFKHVSLLRCSQTSVPSLVRGWSSPQSSWSAGYLLLLMSMIKC